MVAELREKQALEEMIAAMHAAALSSPAATETAVPEQASPAGPAGVPRPEASAETPCR